MNPKNLLTLTHTHHQLNIPAWQPPQNESKKLRTRTYTYHQLNIG